jgi:hypothetical protein
MFERAIVAVREKSLPLGRESELIGACGLYRDSPFGGGFELAGCGRARRAHRATFAHVRTEPGQAQRTATVGMSERGAGARVARGACVSFEPVGAAVLVPIGISQCRRVGSCEQSEGRRVEEVDCHQRTATRSFRAWRGT